MFSKGGKMERKKIIIVAALAIGIVAWRMGAMEGEHGQMIALVTNDGKKTSITKDRAMLFGTVKDLMEDLPDETEIPVRIQTQAALQAVVDDIPWVLRVLGEKRADETEQQAVERMVKPRLAVPFNQAALEQLIAKVNVAVYLYQPALLERYTKEIADMLMSNESIRRLVRNDAPILQYIPSEIVQGLSKYINNRADEQYEIRYNEDVRSVAISADGNKVVTGSHDTAKIVAWDGNAWVEQYTIRHTGIWGQYRYVQSVAISADGNKVVTGSWDNTAKLVAWDGTAWVEQDTIQLYGIVRSVAISADGNKVVTGYADMAKIFAWDGTAWVEQYTIQHDGWVVSVAVSVDGTRVVTGSWDNTAKIVTWNGNAWVEQDTIRHNGEVTSVAISADGTRVVTGSMDKTAKIVAWNGTAWVEQYTIAHNGTVRPVAISANGNKVVTGSKDKTAKIVAWNGTAWIEQYTIAHNGPVWSVAISADGTRVVTGSEYNTKIVAWNGTAWVEQYEFAHITGVDLVGISANGNKVVTGSSKDKTAKIYLCLPASLPGLSDFETCLFELLLVLARAKKQKISKSGWVNNILNMIEWQKLRREDQAELKKLIRETVQQ
jgi:WD40 repeat protein